MSVPAEAVLIEEREHLDIARRCLVAMRESAEHIADYGVDALASESLGRLRAERLAALTAEPDAPPFFGRIDRSEQDVAEALHIGRRHIRDDVGDPVVIDWRAPIARGFYRATATVGLHRAAYLLYTYPDRLRRTGVLVVGPNQAFLHYIAQVLPALGEGGIEQSTVDALVGHVPVRAQEPAALATLKGDARMAEVLARAVRSQVGKPAGDVVALVGTRRFRIPEQHLRRYVDDARRSGIRWRLARERLRQQIAEDVRRQREDAGGAPSDAETARVGRSSAVTEFLDAVWPMVDAKALLTRLYRDADFLARCAPMLSAAERESLARTPVRWTAADAVLIDELVGLIEGVASYVHVVVDEAQDLSAMQCRAIARRCPLGSLTVLGDQAQATTPWAAGSWPATLEHLGHPEAVLRPLTTGYRVPGEVLELANRLLPHIAPDLGPAGSVRSGAGTLRFSDDLVTAVEQCGRADGSVGVIVADSAVPAVLERLAGTGAEHLTGSNDPRIAVIEASAAKGLEFDSVVVVEPEDIVAGEPTRLTGLRRLYVVLTRAVSRLVVVHGQPLPPELDTPVVSGRD